MDDARISQLKVAAPLSGSEYIPITQLQPDTNVLRTLYTNPDAFKNFVFGSTAESFCPPGLIVSYAGSVSAVDTPSGWLLCDGRSVMRSTYSKLFEKIGTTYGSINDKSFNLPNLKGRVVMGYCDTASSITLSGISDTPACSSKINYGLQLVSSAKAYLIRTPAVVGNRGVWTWSGWVKRNTLGTLQFLFGSGISTSGGPGIDYLTGITFTTSNKLGVYWGTSGTGGVYVESTSVLNNTGVWYNIVLVANTTTITLYVNGLSVASAPIASVGAVNSLAKQAIGALWDTTNSTYIYHFDGILSDINFIDGEALTPDVFGETNSCNTWVPRTYTGAYGINGYYLNFADGSAATAAAIGNDASLNSNNWTPINITTDDAIRFEDAQSSRLNPVVSVGSVGGEFNHQLVAAELPLLRSSIAIGTIPPVLKSLYNSGTFYGGSGPISMNGRVPGGLKSLFGGTLPQYITFNYGFGQSCGLVTNAGSWQSLGCSGNNSYASGSVTVAPDKNGDVFFQITNQGWGGHGLNVSIYLPGASTSIVKDISTTSALPFNVAQPYMVMNYIIKY